MDALHGATIADTPGRRRRYGHADAPTMVPLGFQKFQEELETEAVRLSAEWMKQAGFADGIFETGEFERIRERARALVLAAPKNVEPPSLRKKRP